MIRSGENNMFNYIMKYIKKLNILIFLLTIIIFSIYLKKTIESTKSNEKNVTVENFVQCETHLYLKKYFNKIKKNKYIFSSS